MAESFNDFIAGWIGGAAGIIVGSPLDVLKARLQAPVIVNDINNYGLLETSEVTHSRLGSWQVFRNMIQTEGLSSMFKGVLSPVVGLAVLNALLFGSYGSILRYFERQQQHNDEFQHGQGPFQPTLLEIYLAGTGAGLACFLISTPIELIKIKTQMTKIPKSTLQVTKEIYAATGLKGFYQGGIITMVRDAPSYGIYFWVYEGVKRTLQTNEDNAAWKLLLAGGIAGTISWASIYPVDVVKSRLQMQQQQQHQIVNSNANSTTRRISLDRPYASITDCIVRSYKTEGVGVFFRGLWPTLLRGFPVNAVTFYVYEIVIKLLN